MHLERGCICYSLLLVVPLYSQIFCEVAYKAKTVEDLISGVDEFMDDLTVLPPSVWDPQTRLEPPTKSMSVVRATVISYQLAVSCRPYKPFLPRDAMHPRY